MAKTYKDIEQEFDEKVNELRRETHWGHETDSPIHDFGCKTQRKIISLNGNEVTELFTIPDWGKIKQFLKSSIQTALEAVRLKEISEKDIACLDPKSTEDFVQAHNTIKAIQDSNIRNFMGEEGEKV